MDKIEIYNRRERIVIRIMDGVVIFCCLLAGYYIAQGFWLIAELFGFF